MNFTMYLVSSNVFPNIGIEHNCIHRAVFLKVLDTPPPPPSFYFTESEKGREKGKDGGRAGESQADCYASYKA